MSYTYDAGTTTPTLSGLCELGGIRINDGTFKSSSLGPLDGSAPLHVPTLDLPSDDGGFAGTQFYGGWAFTLAGWIYVTSSADDVPAAKDQLRGAVKLQGLQTLVFNARSWTAKRQMLAMIDGSIVFSLRHGLRRTATVDFQIPMYAPDPRLYNADTLQSVVVGTGSTNLTNNGNYPTPFTVTFAGGTGAGWVNPSLVAPSGAKIEFTGLTIAAGDSRIVTTNPAAATGITVTNGAGTNLYAQVTSDDAGALLITPGTTGWHVGGTPGVGSTATVVFRDAWV